MHLVINSKSANHTLVTWVHQPEVGERRAAPLELTPPGGFLAIEEGGSAASLSLTTDQLFQIALLTDRPLLRWVNNRSKDLGSRNCEEKLVLPERCSIRLNTFLGIQTFV